VERALLHLPYVTELVRDEVVRRVGVAHEDRPHQGVAVVAAEPRHPEEPWRDEDPDPPQRDRLGVEVERVEPRLRPRRLVASATEVSSMTALPSCAWRYSYVKRRGRVSRSTVRLSVASSATGVVVSGRDSVICSGRDSSALKSRFWKKSVVACVVSFAVSVLGGSSVITESASVYLNE
jgi:hypothetical protein